MRDMLHSYSKALKEGINVWKVVPHSTKFLFFVELIARSSFATIQTLFLVYAFYVIQIGGAPDFALAPQTDPALQLARVRWGYVMIALFMCMIILSFPVGKVIDKVGRKIPLMLSGILMIPAVLSFVFGNYLTVFIAMPLVGLSMLLGFSSSQTLFADLVPQTQRGKVTGSMNFFTNIFMAISGAVGGLLYDTISPQVPFIITAVLAVPAIALVVLYVQEPKPEERET